MGLQLQPLISMACLDVETPGVCRGQFKSVLQLRLQQRRTREQLVEQGIMPPLKTPAAFHEKIRSLERARTENFLKHKIRSRPKRSELVRMHILQETQAQPALQATQMMLKRARLADDLKEKLAQRPGPMELVVKNILPVERNAIAGPEPGTGGSNGEAVEEDSTSNEAPSPEGPASQESQSSSSASPKERRRAEPPSGSPPASCVLQNHPATSRSSPADVLQTVSPTDPQTSWHTSVSHGVGAAASLRPGPALVKQSQPKTPGDKTRSKKSKEAKPRVKKLKYHQYIPPDHKQHEAHEAPMDSGYARLLQQQQQFLQLQILSQQQHFNYQAILPSPIKAVEIHNGCPNVALSGGGLSHPVVVSLPSGGPARSNQTPAHRKPGLLPPNLDEMKVAELKVELKLRGLPVSGTKTDLIERLKPHQDGAAAPLEPQTSPGGSRRPASANRTPPVSPVPSDVAAQATRETTTAAAGQSKLPGAWSPSSGRSPRDDGPAEGAASEKDQQLQAKEQQIEALMRKLEREQRLVEELRLQLEEEGAKRGSPPRPGPPVWAEEEAGPPSLRASPPAPAAAVKREEPPAPSLCPAAPPCFGLSRAGTRTAPPPVALPAAGVGVEPPVRQTEEPQSAAPAPVCASTEASATAQDGGLQTGSTFILQRPAFTNHAPRSRDPPRYEEAVKQRRSMQTAAQVPSATSQHMDDLFDVLIESGEISPFVRQDLPTLNKLRPVTASVTTLPINTALSRPPPQVQVAGPPAPAGTPPGPVSLATDTQLEAFLEGTLAAHEEPQALRLMEELQGHLLEHPHSPAEGMELGFSHAAPPPSMFRLTEPSLDHMEWLDISLPGPAGGLNGLGLSAQTGVFSTDFLDGQDLQIQW